MLKRIAQARTFLFSVVLLLGGGLGAFLSVQAVADVTFDPGPSVTAAIPLETVRLADAGIAWTRRMVTPDATQRAALDNMLRLLVAMAGVTLLLGVLGTGTLVGLRRGAMGRDVAIRRAVGASLRQVRREAGMEALLVGLIVAAFGALLGELGQITLTTTWPHAGALAVSTDWLRTAGAALVLGTTLMVAIVQLLGSPRGPERGPVAPGPGVGGSTPGLAILQIGLSVPLAVTAILLSKAAVDGPASVPAGDREAAVVLEVSAVSQGESVADRLAAYESLLDTLAGMPGVRVAALMSPGAQIGIGTNDFVLTECGNCWEGGLPMPVKGADAVHHLLSPDTFSTLGLTLLQGRDFLPADRLGSEPVAMVSETFAWRNFGKGNPLGKRIRIGGDMENWYTVVGVVDDPGSSSLGSGELPRGEIYLSALQHPPIAADVILWGTPSIAGALRAVDEQGILRVDRTLPMQDYLKRQAAPLRWFGIVLAGAAVVALSLSALGVLLLVRAQVAERRGEIGLRRAVGARRRDVFRLFCGYGLGVGLTGGVFGAWLSLFAVAAMESNANATLPVPWQLLFTVAGAHALMALVGSAVPARSAARLEPVQGLRQLVG